jgi:hypothetical protein
MLPPPHLTVVELRAFRPSHSPSAPPPMAINDRRHGGSSSTGGAQATTVHCMRTCARKKVGPGTGLVWHHPHQGKNDDRNRVQQSRILYDWILEPKTALHQERCSKWELFLRNRG